jgi:transcriptional regulator with XRE-family HTH domain
MATITPLRPTSRLRQLREAADESRGGLAQALGVGSALIKQWERGQLSIPDERARVLARRYGVSIAYLLREKEPIHGRCPMCGAERAR